MHIRSIIAFAILLMFCHVGTANIAAAATSSSEKPVYTLKIRDHRFEPSELEVPAGVKVKLMIVNEDPTPEEFESYDLNREKMIMGKGKAVVFIGPLKEGAYKFFGEFNPDTAQGVIRVMPQESAN